MKRTIRPPRFPDYGAALLVVAMLLPAVCSRAAEPRDVARHPSWAKLKLGARKFFLGATTSIEISRVPRRQALAKLRNLPAGHAARLPGSEVDVIRTSTSMPFGRFERAIAWIDAASGAVLQTEKVTSGSRMYWKVRRFGLDGYYQWRRAPANVREKKRSRRQWSKASSRWFRWSPAPPPGAPVTSSYALLALVSEARLDRPGARMRLLIPSHGRLVELRFTSGKNVEATVRYTQTRGEHRRKVHARLKLRKVDVAARWLGGGKRGGPAETGFMGMRGPLVILIQPGAGLPVRVIGNAKGIGRLVVRLRAVTFPSARTGSARSALE